MKRIKFGHKNTSTQPVIPDKLVEELTGIIAQHAQETPASVDIIVNPVVSEVPTEPTPEDLNNRVNDIVDSMETQPIEPIDPKNTLDNADINELFGFDVDLSEFKQKILETIDSKISSAMLAAPTGNNSECNTIKNLVIKERETARFVISTENQCAIMGFTYDLITPTNLICTSHIEKITGNNVSIIINNLNNKVVTFGIQYIAFF